MVLFLGDFFAFFSPLCQSGSTLPDWWTEQVLHRNIEVSTLKGRRSPGTLEET